MKRRTAAGLWEAFLRFPRKLKLDYCRGLAPTMLSISAGALFLKGHFGIGQEGRATWRGVLVPPSKRFPGRRETGHCDRTGL